MNTSVPDNINPKIVNWPTVVTIATEAAVKATAEYIRANGEHYPCGFAWVNIKPARGPLIKYLKEIKFGRTDDYYGGYTIWNPSENATQCMDAKEAGARAFAEVLKKYGVKCFARTRLD